MIAQWLGPVYDRRVSLIVLFVLLLTGSLDQVAAQGANSAKAPRKPNIIYILADDMGYGDLSCYGQQRFQTPNIDRIARDGIQFMQHYAGTAVCAPSRSSLMTGQTTGYTPIRGNSTGNKKPASLPDTVITIAELMKQAGYATGAFGKWGLGAVGSEGDPNKQGFDEFYGYISQGLAHSYYPDFLVHNQQKVILEKNLPDKKVEYAPDLIHQQVLHFIDKNRDRPFFIYYPTTIPHAELAAPEKYMARFRGKLLPEKTFKGVSYGAPNYKKGGYESQPEGHAAFAAMITLLDHQVGEILDRLKQYGLDDHTLVIFSSDNGPHLEGGADPEYFNSNGPYRGYKRDLYEGGIREPMLARWPGHIAAGSKTDRITAFWDVMPTLAELVHVKTPANTQGLSFLPTLLGKGTQKEHDHLYWEFHEFGGRQAIRKGRWKYIVYNVLNKEKRKAQLFDLDKDPGEQEDIALQYPDVVKELQEVMEQSRVPAPQFPFIESLK
ncbi:Arylsulfatase A [Niabella drilacis]|uniref:Arylsulfatase A n=2 Tax=Niabella drilacis (strain DSM 25811 / CCM 8410 / CCUG 62505 / LMG 26954 / E90) TaxID=1285928 RepID=A0A1G6RHR3_NIADE|nr:Arylsulfatase A [Niabella drilacis]